MAAPKPKIPTRDRTKLAKALAKLEAHVSIDCVRVPLLIDALAEQLAPLGSHFAQDIEETTDLIVRLEAKLKHSLLGAVLEPATREVAENAIAHLRHDLFAQRRYPVMARWVGELIAKDAKWPDGTPAWAVSSRGARAGQLEARLRAKPIDLKPREIALIFKYGASGGAFRVADDGGDNHGRVTMPNGALGPPKKRRSLRALANRVGVAIETWKGQNCSVAPPTVPVAPVIDAMMDAKPPKKS